MKEVVKEKIIGDLKIIYRFGGNLNHKKFFHLFCCYLERVEKEEILCNPTIVYERSYYSCGFWREVKYEKIKNE